MRIYLMPFRSTTLIILSIVFSLLLFIPGGNTALVVPAGPEQNNATTETVTLSEVLMSVDSYLKAVRDGNWETAYSLTSAESIRMVSEKEWTTSAQRISADSHTMLPINKLPDGAESCEVLGISISGGKAATTLKVTYSLPLELFMIQEGNTWRVDLPTCEGRFISNLAEDITEGIMGQKGNSINNLNARSILQPFIVSHHVDQIQIDGTKASVKVYEKAIVPVQINLERHGPFWSIVLPEERISEVGSPSVTPAPQNTQETKPRQNSGQEWFPAPRNWRK